LKHNNLEEGQRRDDRGDIGDGRDPGEAQDHCENRDETIQ